MQELNDDVDDDDDNEITRTDLEEGDENDTQSKAGLQTPPNHVSINPNKKIQDSFAAV